VVVIVPASIVPSVVEESGKKGVKDLIILSAGFKEVGADGAELERQVFSIAQKYSMRMLGPNCLGVINADPSVRLNASFASGMPPQGSIAFASQSGALGEAVLDYAAGGEIGGFRGQPPRDVEAVAECIKRLSQLAMDLEEVQELVNQLLVFEKGCKAVDARVILAPQ
jgi:ATP-grasp domain/CoA binding domain